MSEQYHALTVVLDERLDAAEVRPLMQAIERLQGVAAVRPHVSDAAAAFAEQQALQAVAGIIDAALGQKRVAAM